MDVRILSMDREVFRQQLEKGERQAERMNRVAGIEVAVGLLSISPKAVRAAFFMRRAVDEGVIRDSFPVPHVAYYLAHKLNIYELRKLACIRGIGFD